MDNLRELCSKPLSLPSREELFESTLQAAHWLLEKDQTLGQLPVGQFTTPEQLSSLLSGHLSEAGQGFSSVFKEFQESVAPYAMRVDHPRFLAFIPSAPTFVSVIAEFLCAGINSFAAVWLEAAAPTQVELLVIDWFKDWLGYPNSASGILTGGGSEANLTALAIAHESLRYEDRAKAIIYMCDQRHWSVDRAAKVIGLRPDQIRLFPSRVFSEPDLAPLDRAYREDRQAGFVPWLMVANAGTTNTGAIDAMEGLSDWCKAKVLWLHVDAAYGWAACLVPEGRKLLMGIDQADSITLDPHKWLAQPFDAGCLLVRQGDLLAKTFAMRPDYMKDVEPTAGEVNFADCGIALTRRFRALKIWFSAKTLGLAWFHNLVRHSLNLAKYSEEVLRRFPGFEILQAGPLSIVSFRYIPAKWRNSGDSQAVGRALDDFQIALCQALRKTHEAFLSTTVVNGHTSLRFCFVNWRTTASDVDYILQRLAELGEELAKDMPK